MKFLIAILLASLPVFAANPAVTYDSVTRNISPTNGNLRVATFTNEAATASAIAKYDANKKLGSAVSGTDYAPATSGAAILKGNSAGGFANAASGTDYAPATSGSSVLKGNGAGGFSNAASGTDYAPATSGSAILKGNGAGGFSAASAGTDYANTGQKISYFAATTSAEFFSVISDESGNAGVVPRFSLTSAAQGDVIYYNGSAWVNLAPGVSGLFLQTQGAGSNPVWASGGASSPTAWNDIADATGNGTIDLVATQQTITGSAEDGAMLEIRNTDTVSTHDTTILQTSFDMTSADNSNKNIYFKAVSDRAGTPVTDYEFSQTLATFRIPISTTGSGQGQLNLGDADNSNFFTVTPNPTTTTDVAFVGPAAPFSGMAKWTVTATTNWAPSQATVGLDYSGPIFVQTSDVTIANSAAEATVLGTVTGSKTLASNALAQGKNLRGVVRGRYSSDAVTPGTMRIRVKLGATTILDTSTQTTPTAASGKLFDVDYDITCRTTGGTGTIWAQGKVVIGDVSGLVPQVLPMVNTATSTIDTTGTLVVDVTMTWSVADADNTITISMASLVQ